MAPVAHATAPFSAPLQAATPVPDPEPALTPTPAATVIPAPNPITQIFQHVINFDATDSLLSAWTRVLERLRRKPWPIWSRCWKRPPARQRRVFCASARAV
jgi:hypothetical protein